MTATAIVYWVSALATGQPVLPAQIPSDAWPGLVGVGVAATFLAIQTFYAGARRVGAAHASLISTAEPIWTIALAAILFQVGPDADPARRAARSSWSGSSSPRPGRPPSGRRR